MTVQTIERRRPLAATIDDRIASAFKSGAKSNDVATLIEEVDAAVLASASAADKARHRALDPSRSMVEAAEARALMEDCEFKLRRLQAAVIQLGQRLAELRMHEEDDKRRAAYEAVEAERDALAAELKAVYPEAAQRIVDVLKRVAANDAEIARVNRKSPSGRGELLGAELVARGLQGFQRGLTFVPCITQRVCLPRFEYDPHDRFAWPRPK